MQKIDVTKMSKFELVELQKQIEERLADMPKTKRIDNPRSWTNEERIQFHDIVWTWITINDHTYDLYKFLRESQDGDDGELYAYPYDEYVAEFHRLFNEDLDKEHMLGCYEDHYLQEKAEYEEYKRQRELEKAKDSKVNNKTKIEKLKEELAGKIPTFKVNAEDIKYQQMANLQSHIRKDFPDIKK